MKIETKKLSALVRSIMNAGKQDIGCDACLDTLDEFVDLHLAGRTAADSLPLVKYHLDQCADCQEEFQILLEVLQNNTPDLIS
jgi:hypothetical protein